MRFELINFEKNKDGQLFEVPATKCSTTRNVGLLDFRDRDEIGYNQTALVVRIWFN